MKNAWDDAPATIPSLCSQLKFKSASLGQVQTLILGDADILHDKPALVGIFNTTLTSCLVLSQWVERYVNKITKGILDGKHESWKTRPRLCGTKAKSMICLSTYASNKVQLMSWWSFCKSELRPSEQCLETDARN